MTPLLWIVAGVVALNLLALWLGHRKYQMEKGRDR
jgi:hypothetical protein